MKYPIILLDYGRESIEILDSLYIHTDKLSLKKQKLKNFCYIIDALGCKYLIESVEKIKNEYPIWKFEFFNPSIQVKINVKETETQIDLITFKHELLKIFSKDSTFWDSDGRLAEKINFINDANTICETLNFMSSEGFGSK